MAQQFPPIIWQFSASDYGTHSGNYLQKLKDLVDEYNVVLVAVNAQLTAGEDSLAIKSDIISIRDVDMLVLINHVTDLRDETIALRDQAIVISLGDINGQNVDFGNVKVNGFDVYHPNNKPTKTDIGLVDVDNTSDADKPISTATQAALDAQQVQIDEAILLSLGVR